MYKTHYHVLLSSDMVDSCSGRRYSGEGRRKEEGLGSSDKIAGKRRKRANLKGSQKSSCPLTLMIVRRIMSKKKQGRGSWKQTGAAIRSYINGL
jgi:hypothetical protein